MGAYLLSLATSIIGALVFGAILLWWHRLLERRLPAPQLPADGGRTDWRTVAPSALAFGVFLFSRDALMREGVADGLVGFLGALAIGLLAGALGAYLLRSRKPAA